MSASYDCLAAAVSNPRSHTQYVMLNSVPVLGAFNAVINSVKRNVVGFMTA